MKQVPLVCASCHAHTSNMGSEFPMGGHHCVFTNFWCCVRDVRRTHGEEALPKMDKDEVPPECPRAWEHEVLGQTESLLQTLPELKDGEGTDSEGHKP